MQTHNNKVESYKHGSMVVKPKNGSTRELANLNKVVKHIHNSISANMEVQCSWWSGAAGFKNKDLLTKQIVICGVWNCERQRRWFWCKVLCGVRYHILHIFHIQHKYLTQSRILAAICKHSSVRTTSTTAPEIQCKRNVAHVFTMNHHQPMENVNPTPKQHNE